MQGINSVVTPLGYNTVICETNGELEHCAVLCACDNMAVGAIDFMYDNNIQVPEHISVTGADDSNLATTIRPSLTTIRHATFDTGVKAAQLLLEYFVSDFFRGSAFKMPYQLLLRQSVKHL